MPGRGSNAFVTDLLERLEQSVNVFRRDNRTSVTDRNARPVSDCAGHDRDRATGDVVTQRVVDQICNQALDQSWIAQSSRSGEVGVDRRPRR